jgi:hypothetical protein
VNRRGFLTALVAAVAAPVVAKAAEPQAVLLEDDLLAFLDELNVARSQQADRYRWYVSDELAMGRAYHGPRRRPPTRTASGPVYTSGLLPPEWRTSREINQGIYDDLFVCAARDKGSRRRPRAARGRRW